MNDTPPRTAEDPIEDAFCRGWWAGHAFAATQTASRFTAPVVVMCGSVRFRSTWAAEMARLTDKGNIVLTVGRMLPKAEGKFDPAHKARLDDLHKRKIDLADWVWVLDVGGYIGASTQSEIAYAEKIGRPVRYLSRAFPDYVEPLDEQTQTAALRALVKDGAKLAFQIEQVGSKGHQPTLTQYINDLSTWREHADRALQAGEEWRPDDDTIGLAYARWSPPMTELRDVDVDPVSLSARAFKAGYLAAVEKARQL